jgi:hypothetical protein
MIRSVGIQEDLAAPGLVFGRRQAVEDGAGQAGSPTRKRRAFPVATATFIPSDTVPPDGSATDENRSMARCMSSAQAMARRPSSPSSQHVIASPAKPMTLPPYLSNSQIRAS